ncbi:MAG: phosphoribosylglycinamide formyltransferase [Verrucomicrobia bacterium]|nr:phosphoribosylglycinamide formyltransferase [Verrucomicrobiota bacterium]
MRKIRLGVLGSGSGSNFQALLDASQSGTLDAQIVLVLSDVVGAGILDRARNAKIPTGLIDCRDCASKFPLEAQQETAGTLKKAAVDLVCLAGFMRMIKSPLLDAFPGRIINIHPSLLPAFPGLEAWKQALDAGVGETGCTVHYVDAGMDSGEIILQAAVPVLADDTATTLHARIQQQEHRIYPLAVNKIAATIP